MATNTRALIGAIARYGDQMAELAEAEDLKTAQNKAEAAGGAVKALTIAAGLPAIAGPIIDAGLFAVKQNMVAKRRRALLVNALAAKPAIAAAADAMAPIAESLRNNMMTYSEANLRDLDLRIGESFAQEAKFEKQVKSLETRAARGNAAAIAALALATERLEDVRARRRGEVTLLLQSARGFNSARGLNADFSVLNRAHDQLIKKLQNPKGSTENVLADINTFLTILDAMVSASNQ
jgi:hypothetical protein